MNTMNLATAKMLSEALSQYIENATDEDDYRTPQEYINLAEATRLLSEADAIIATGVLP